MFVWRDSHPDREKRDDIYEAIPTLYSEILTNFVHVSGQMAWSVAQEADIANLRTVGEQDEIVGRLKGSYPQPAQLQKCSRP